MLLKLKHNIPEQLVSIYWRQRYVYYEILLLTLLQHHASKCDFPLSITQDIWQQFCSSPLFPATMHGVVCMLGSNVLRHTTIEILTKKVNDIHKANKNEYFIVVTFHSDNIVKTKQNLWMSICFSLQHHNLIKQMY